MIGMLLYPEACARIMDKSQEVGENEQEERSKRHA